MPFRTTDISDALPPGDAMHPDVAQHYGRRFSDVAHAHGHTLPAEAAGIVAALASCASGPVTLRVVTARDYRDARLAYYADD